MNALGILVSSFVVSGSLGTFAWRTAEARHAGDTERQILATRRIALVSELRERKAEFASVRRRLEETPPIAPADPAPSSTSPATATPKPADSFLEWLEDPAVQVLYLAKQRAELPQTYGLFFRAANLTPDEVERLSEIIIESRAHTHDMSEINRLRGVPFSDSAMVAERERTTAEHRRRKIELLGEERFAQLEDYARALEVRTYVGRMAGNAAVEGCSLSWQQADALGVVLASTCPEYFAGGKARLNQINWKVAESQAERILTPEQMAFLRNDSPKAVSLQRRIQLATAVHRALREVGGTGVPKPRGTQQKQ